MDVLYNDTILSYDKKRYINDQTWVAELFWIVDNSCATCDWGIVLPGVVNSLYERMPSLNSLGLYHVCYINVLWCK